MYLILRKENVMDDFENISAVSIDGGYLLNKRYKLEKKMLVFHLGWVSG